MSKSTENSTFIDTFPHQDKFYLIFFTFILSPFLNIHVFSTAIIHQLH